LQDPISKITRAKWNGGVAQAVVCLLCKHLLWKHEAIQTPIPPKKKERKKEKNQIG
jgi:hypothetical protein